MSIRFITNTVWRDAAKIEINDLTRVDGDVQNLVDGPIYAGLQTTHNNGSSDDNWIYKKNDSYTLTADTCVIAGAANTLDWGSGYKLQYLDLSGGWTDITPAETSGATWEATTDASALIGPRSDNFLFTFTEITDAAAYRIAVQSMDATAYASEFQKWFMSDSFSFASTVYLNAWRQQFALEHTKAGDVFFVTDYDLRAQWSNVARSDIETFKAQYALFTQPFFIYNSDARFLADKLWYVVLVDFQETLEHDDAHQVNMQFKRIKDYSDYYGA